MQCSKVTKTKGDKSNVLNHTGTHEFRSWDAVTILFDLALQSIPEITWSCWGKKNHKMKLFVKSPTKLVYQL